MLAACGSLGVFDFESWCLEIGEYPEVGLGVNNSHIIRVPKIFNLKKFHDRRRINCSLIFRLQFQHWTVLISFINSASKNYQEDSPWENNG